MSADHTLVVLARRPMLGHGKRRLAADIGDAAAYRFQRVALARLLRNLGKDSRWRLCLALTPDEPPQFPGVDFVVGQGEGDLGERMSRLICSLPEGPIIFIGSDTPDITSDDIATAFQALEAHDAVIGPATDGGYWLIGFAPQQRDALPFSGVRWSTAETRADTVKNLADKRVAMLVEREDVDDGASYRHWLHRTVRGLNR